LLFVETLESASTSRFLSGYGKIKFYDLILLGIHCNGYGQIFKENLPQNQRFCVETSLFRLTITIIKIIAKKFDYTNKQTNLIKNTVQN